MGKFAVKIERVITIALILSVMLILTPGVSTQAKAKKCNHKSVTWITTSKSSCTDEGMKVKKCKNCGKILKIKKIRPKQKCSFCRGIKALKPKQKAVKALCFMPIYRT